MKACTNLIPKTCPFIKTVEHTFQDHGYKETKTYYECSKVDTGHSYNECCTMLDTLFCPLFNEANNTP